MNTYKYIVQSGIVAALCLVTAACGSGGSGDDDKAAVVWDLFADDPAVSVGDDVDLDVLFSYANETVVEDNYNVIVVVRIPNGLAYEPDTARVDEIGGTDSVTPAIEICANGDTYLRFNLGQNVLENATDPDGPADGRLKMAIAGINPVGDVTFEAAAGYEFEVVPGSCVTPIVAQRTFPFIVTN